MGCPEQAMPIPAAMFVIGVILLTLFVAWRERLPVKDALLVLIGLKRYETSPAVTAFLIVVFTVPFGTWFALYRVCSGSFLPP
ncbi:MAG: hypothetical protein AAFQ15_18760 [Pseudomonadota bacterium]